MHIMHKNAYFGRLPIKMHISVDEAYLSISGVIRVRNCGILWFQNLFPRIFATPLNIPSPEENLPPKISQVSRNSALGTGGGRSELLFAPGALGSYGRVSDAYAANTCETSLSHRNAKYPNFQRDHPCMSGCTTPVTTKSYLDQGSS